MTTRVYLNRRWLRLLAIALVMMLLAALLVVMVLPAPVVPESATHDVPAYMLAIAVQGAGG